MQRTKIILALAVVIFLGACKGDSGLRARTDATELRDRALAPVVPAAPDAESPQAPGREAGAIPPELYAAARADCAERSGKPEDALEVVRAKAVTWRDGSLGCPEPGMMYTHALVEGYWLVFTDGRREFDYRAGRGGKFMYCAEPRAGPAPADAN